MISGMLNCDYVYFGSGLTAGQTPSPAECMEPELIGEYRRLRNLRRNDQELNFPNSRMLPSCNTSLGDETVALDYWNHTRPRGSFDCCMVHRSRKQCLLEIVQAEVAAAHRAEEQEKAVLIEHDINDHLKTLRRDRLLSGYRRGAQKVVEENQVLKHLPATSQIRRIDTYETPEALRYKLLLINQRLKRMAARAS